MLGLGDRLIKRFKLNRCVDHDFVSSMSANLIHKTGSRPFYFLSNPFQILQHSVNKSRMLNQFG